MQRFKLSSLWLLIHLFIVGGSLHSQHSLSKSQVRKALKEFTTDSLLKSASISFSLLDLRNGKKIASYDEHRALVPASSQKIITSAFILNEFNSGFRFITPFYLRGQVLSDGCFLGNLEITGSGDPGFGSEYFPDQPGIQNIADTITSILKRKGISRIHGKIVVDENFVKDVPENKEWLWYDLGNYYGAGCFGFNFAENQAKITLSAAKNDGAVCEIFRVLPEVLRPVYTSKVIGISIPIEKDVYVLGNSQSCKQEILGEWKCCNADTLMIRSALSKPSEVFIFLLTEALKKNGISIDETKSEVSKNNELIYSYLSPSLTDLVQRALVKSVNLYCESFLHILGNKWNGNTSRQLALIKMNEMFSGIIYEKDGFVFEDGSGLSPKNMISASAFVEFLNWIHKTDSLQNFWQLLPDNTKQGPMSKWIKVTEMNTLHPRLKSGTMERVKSYTGYLVENDRPVYALSLMVNHYTCSGETMNELIARFLNQVLKS